MCLKLALAAAINSSLSISSYSQFLLLLRLHRLYKIMTTSNDCITALLFSYYTVMPLSVHFAPLSSPELWKQSCSWISPSLLCRIEHFPSNRWTDGVSGLEVCWLTALDQYLWLIRVCIAVALSIDKSAPRLSLLLPVAESAAVQGADPGTVKDAGAAW